MEKQIERFPKEPNKISFREFSEIMSPLFKGHKIPSPDEVKDIAAKAATERYVRTLSKKA
jgi:hypothetical protein